jgi:hypothetical protein
MFCNLIKLNIKEELSSKPIQDEILRSPRRFFAKAIFQPTHFKATNIET